MSLSITQFQGPAMAATVEQRDRALLLETHILYCSISIRILSVSSGQVFAETEATQKV